jgi:hypothetical protein
MEELFRLEVTFNALLRSSGVTALDVGQLHASYTIECGYERLIRVLGSVSDEELERVKTCLAGEADPRDVLRARDTIRGFLMTTSRPDRGESRGEEGT